MDDAQQAPGEPSEEEVHVGPPDLILQAIVPPTDAPMEIRAVVADALARDQREGSGAPRWEDITFAASAIALVEGTNRRAEPDTQWVFALRAQAPKLGEQVRGVDGGAHSIRGYTYSNGTGRVAWQVSVFDVLETVPRQAPGTSA